MNPRAFKRYIVRTGPEWVSYSSQLDGARSHAMQCARNYRGDIYIQDNNDEISLFRAYKKLNRSNNSE